MKNILLGVTDSKDITLVQAILLLKNRGIQINQVKYIRTGGEQIDENVKLFFSNEGIIYSNCNINNCGVLTDENDYLIQEDELMQWYIDSTRGADNVFVFIGGGHKLHSLALQKCAFLFGADDIFHMFVNVSRGEEPKWIQDIETAIESGKILYASIGREAGWPALKSMISNRSVNSNTIREILDKIGHQSVNQINEFPFECLNFLPINALNWLYQEFSDDDVHWIILLPKTELHCHLGGFATSGDLLQTVRNNADETTQIGPEKEILFPDEWPLPSSNISLDTYMALGDNSGSYILSNTGCLRKQIEIMYEHFMEQNIRYAEVRCSPYNYATEKMNGPQILESIMNTFDEKMAEAKANKNHFCHVNLIIIATRTLDINQGKIDLHLQLAENVEQTSNEYGKCKVVGVDLAGFERPETRAKYFATNFTRIHRAGIALTIHAGENDEAEGIWQAVFDLNTRRIGHGLHLYQDLNLLKSIVNRNIGIEMCPYANYQIKGFRPMPSSLQVYPLMQYLRAGVKVTINTDNIGISEASLSDNFLLLAKMNPEITRMDVLQLIRNGIDQTFTDVSLKNQMIRNFNEEIFHLIINKTE